MIIEINGDVLFIIEGFGRKRCIEKAEIVKMVVEQEIDYEANN